jgi:hypothetical protein
MPKKASAKAVKLSPLLRSAFEVLEHGLWHFLRSDTSTDMKFALLHVDQSIELLLKERVRAGEKSIYKNPKETISIWGAYDILEKELNCKTRLGTSPRRTEQYSAQIRKSKSRRHSLPSGSCNEIYLQICER